MLEYDEGEVLDIARSCGVFWNLARVRASGLARDRDRCDADVTL
jgi:hypothetical protein